MLTSLSKIFFSFVTFAKKWVSQMMEKEFIIKL